MEQTIVFTTHTGESITGAVLVNALCKVADDWAGLAKRIRIADNYAHHVTDTEKDTIMLKMIEKSERIRNGEVGSFTIWQRVNEVITGKCVPLFTATR